MGNQHVSVGQGINRYSFLILDPFSFPTESKYIFFKVSFSFLKRTVEGQGESDWGGFTWGTARWLPLGYAGYAGH